MPSPELARSIVAAVNRLPEALVAALAKESQAAHVPLVQWSSGGTLPSGDLVPTVVLTGLRPGERKIPQDVFDLANRFPDARLLLLSAEPLVRPSVTFQEGRVTLLGPPHSGTRVLSRARLLLAKGGGVPSLEGELLPGTSAPVDQAASQAHLGLYWWVGALAYRDVLWIHGDETQGFTAVVGSASGSSPSATQIEKLREVLRADQPDAELEKALGGLLESGTGLVHLTPGADEWVFFWPGHTCPLWISSALRLPSFFDLAHGATPRLLRMTAASGDVVMALSRGGARLLAGRDSATAKASLLAAMAEGGPALVDFIQKGLGTPPSPFAGLVVEVR